MTTLERDVHIAPRRVVEGDDAYRPTQVRTAGLLQLL